MRGYFGLNNNYIASLANIGDVNLANVYNRQGIAWDASQSKWVNENLIEDSAVIVNRLSDLPAPDGNGIIHLADETWYKFNQAIYLSIDSKLEFGTGTYLSNATIECLGLTARDGGTFFVFDSVIINDSEDALVSASNLGEVNRFLRCGLYNTNANAGSIFNVSTNGDNNYFILNEVTVSNIVPSQLINSLGTIANFQTVILLCFMANYQVGLTLQNPKGLLSLVGNFMPYPTATNTITYNFAGSNIGPINISLGLQYLLNSSQYLFNFPSNLNYTGVAVLAITPLILGTATPSNIFYTTSLTQKYPIFRFYANMYPSDSTVFNKTIIQNNTQQIDINRFGNISNIWFRIKSDPTKISYENTERITNTGLLMRYIAVEDNNLSVKAFLDCQNYGTNKEYVLSMNIIANGGYDFTVNDANDSLLYTNHGLTLGQSLRLFSTGTLPSGLFDDILYFVTAIISVDEFRIGYQSGGASVALTGTGTGIHTYYKSKQLYNTYNAIMSTGVRQKFILNETATLKYDDKLELLVKTTSTPTANILVDNGTFEIIKG